MSLRENDSIGAPEHLAAETDRPASTFRADRRAYPLPALSDLELERIDDEESPFTDD